MVIRPEFQQLGVAVVGLGGKLEAYQVAVLLTQPLEAGSLQS